MANKVGSSTGPYAHNMLPKQKEKEQKGEIRSYSTAKKMSVILLDRKNFARGVKIAFHSVALSMIRLVATIKGGIFPSHKADYQFTVDSYKAVHVTHRAYKMGCAWAKYVFGNDLISPSRNIAKMEVLKGEGGVKDQEDYKAAVKCSNKLKGNSGLMNLLSDSARSKVNKAEFSVTTRDGVCFGASIHFIKSYFENKKNGEDAAISTAKLYEDGVPAEAAGNQAVYECLKNPTNATDAALNEAFGLDKVTRFLQNITNVDSAIIAYVNDLKPDIPKDINVFSCNQNDLPKHKSLKSTGSKSTKEELELLKTQLKDAEIGRRGLDFETGAYEMSFQTGDTVHTTVFIKEEDGQGYIFDPNYGLINCGNCKEEDSNNPQEAILRLLSLYEPPERQKNEKTYNPENYKLNIVKYIPINNG
jgi:hypothetical protein